MSGHRRAAAPRTGGGGRICGRIAVRLPVILAAVRAAHGTLLMAAPGPVVGVLLGRPADPVLRRVARVLAARQLVQALACGIRPTYAVQALGVEVDLAHAASMIAAAAARRYRRAALFDAAVAGAFATAGACAAVASARRAPLAAGAGWGRLGRLGRLGRFADRLARLLVPGYAATRRHHFGGRTHA